jgi:hypothetical protein
LTDVDEHDPGRLGSRDRGRRSASQNHGHAQRHREQHHRKDQSHAHRSIIAPAAAEPAPD